MTPEQLNQWLQQDGSFFGVTQKIVRKGQFHPSWNNKASAFAFCRESDVARHVVATGSMPLLLNSGKANCQLSLAVGLGTSSGAFLFASPDEPGLPHYEALEEWILRHQRQQSSRASQPEETEEPVTPEGAPSEDSPVEGSEQPVTPPGAFEGSPQPVPEEGPVPGTQRVSGKLLQEATNFRTWVEGKLVFPFHLEAIHLRVYFVHLLDFNVQKGYLNLEYICGPMNKNPLHFFHEL